MKFKTLSAAVAVALLSASASAVDFNGYMRGGVGLAAEGGENVAFEKSKVGRLGNENDLYGEFGFKQEVYNNDGVAFLVDSMLAKGISANQDWEDGNVNVAQFNVQGKGLLGGSETLWAGKRYYQRHDIHITDFYYWNVSGGAGAGIENVEMGPGNLSVAVITSGDDDNATYYTADVRYAGIPLWNKASLEVGVDYDYGHEKNGKSITRDDAVMGTAIVTQNFGGGFNKTVLQYGTGAAGAAMTTYGAGAWLSHDAKQNDATGFRIINWGVASLGDNIEFGHQALFAAASDVDGTDTDDTAYSVVVRPMYKWNEHMRTILEAGIFGETINDADAGGSKFTVAQAWSAGNSFWARPEIRVYASYISDSEGESVNGEDSDLNVGMQVEAWW